MWGAGSGQGGGLAGGTVLVDLYSEIAIPTCSYFCISLDCTRVILFC